MTIQSVTVNVCVLCVLGWGYIPVGVVSVPMVAAYVHSPVGLRTQQLGPAVPVM